MRENASAIPYNGGNYSYLLNFTTKGIAIVAATLTSLDAITTVETIEADLISRQSYPQGVPEDIFLEKSTCPSQSHY